MLTSTLSYSDPSCPECWHFLLLGVSARGVFAPAPDVAQEALGGSVDALYAFFEPTDWLQDWTAARPLQMWWGNARQWAQTAGWWRDARLKREAREAEARGEVSGFLSLADIERGWDGGKEQ